MIEMEDRLVQSGVSNHWRVRVTRKKQRREDLYGEGLALFLDCGGGHITVPICQNSRNDTFKIRSILL